MKAKAIVSLGLMIGLAALSVEALTCTEHLTLAQTIQEQAITYEVAAVTSEPTAEPEHSFTYETAVPTKEPEQCSSRIMNIDVDADEAYLLTKLAMAEAEGEGADGKALVMLVVLNRVLDENFPDKIEDVIYQPGQFSPLIDGRFDEVEPDEECWDALDMIMLDAWDESKGALYFESESASEWHKNNLEYMFEHGNHYFYTDKE